MRRLKFAAFCLVPAIVLFALAESVVRLTDLARPSLRTTGLPEEFAGLMQADDELFWSLRPDADVVQGTTRVRTNSLGLRSPEVGPKQPGELRVLSLGESTTFGVGVEDDETYSACLERSLQELSPARRVRVINAGVSAYSSFQSLKYLERRGLALEPDVVLFYHELNDYLPSSLRDSGHDEIGVTLTDRQLYASRVQGLHRVLLRYWATYRLLAQRRALRKIRAFDTAGFRNPLLEIGLPDVGIPPRMERPEAPGQRVAGLDERRLARRVSEEERERNLIELAELCRDHGIDLLILHPAYIDTQRHECLLTRFCRRRTLPLFEAFDSLHPPESARGQFYVDVWHPNREGHARLARDLARFVLEHSGRARERGS